MRLRGSKLKAILFGFLLVPLAHGPSPAARARGGPLPGLVEHVKRAVVIVNAFDSKERLLSQGSGFFIRQGLVITNLHVVGRASRVEVTTFGGATCAVEGVIALEEGRDLALLRVNGVPEGVATLPVSEVLPRAGEEVFVVSNPHGAPWDVSRGTALGPRDFPEIGRLVPITAPISRGSSGGPVVNLHGRVVGVATMGLRASEEQYFALPAEHVARLRPRSLITFPLLLD